MLDNLHTCGNLSDSNDTVKQQVQMEIWCISEGEDFVHSTWGYGDRQRGNNKTNRNQNSSTFSFAAGMDASIRTVNVIPFIKILELTVFANKQIWDR